MELWNFSFLGQATGVVTSDNKKKCVPVLNIITLKKNKNTSTISTFNSLTLNIKQENGFHHLLSQQNNKILHEQLSNSVL